MKTSTCVLLCILASAGLAVRGQDATFPKPPDRTPASGKELERVQALIAQLNADSFDDREKAEAELTKVGPAALEALNAALKAGLEPEARTRAEHIAAAAQTEIWEGYYCFSGSDFDQEAAANHRRIRFWMKVKREANGDFEATVEEQDDSLGGHSTMKGHVNPATGKLSIEQTYENVGAFRFEGAWNAKTGRMEGSREHEEPLKHIFVLYPRKLTEAETKKYDMDPQELQAELMEIEKD